MTMTASDLLPVLGWVILAVLAVHEAVFTVRHLTCKPDRCECLLTHKLLAGRPLHGQTVTDATYFRKADKVTVRAHVGPFYKLPGWKRRLYSTGPALAVAALLINLALTAAVLAILSACLIVRRSDRARRMLRRALAWVLKRLRMAWDNRAPERLHMESLARMWGRLPWWLRHPRHRNRVQTMGMLLSTITGTASSQVERGVTWTPDYATVEPGEEVARWVLPRGFKAIEGEKKLAADVWRSRVGFDMVFTWKLDVDEPVLVMKRAREMPSTVYLHEVHERVEALPDSKTAIGLDDQGNLVTWDWLCVAEGSLVQTTRGAVPIESVRPGDVATSWQDGKALDAPVEAVLAKGIKACIQVRMRNRTVTVTPDHRLPVLRKSRTGPVPATGGPHSNVWQIEWIAAGSVSRGDHIVTMARTPATGTAVSADLAWLMGLFTGDGHFNQHSVRICVYGELRDRARAAVAREFGVKTHDHPREGLIISSTAVQRHFESLGLTNGSAVKRIPEVVWTADAASREAFLNGYLDADAHRGPRTTALRSCSPELLAQARMLAIGLGWNVSNITCTQRNKPIIIKGKTVKNARPIYSALITPPSARYAGLADRPRAGRLTLHPGNIRLLGHCGAQQLFLDEFFTCERVLGVTDAGERPVYDLVVPGPDNFTADGVLVHNCENPHGMVVAGSRHGKTELNRSLTAQVVRKGGKVYAADCKRVSFQGLEGVPGFELRNNPRDIRAMWELIEEFYDEMELRSTKRLTDKTAEFPRWLLIIEEVLQFSAMTDDWWEEMEPESEVDEGTLFWKPKRGKKTPRVWRWIKSLCWEGAEFGMHVIVDGQDGEFQALKGVRNVLGMRLLGGYQPQQWKACVGTTPVPEAPRTKGRFCLVAGGQTWVQALVGHLDKNESAAIWRDFARAGRRMDGSLPVTEPDTEPDIVTGHDGRQSDKIAGHGVNGVRAHKPAIDSRGVPVSLAEAERDGLVPGATIKALRQDRYLSDKDEQDGGNRLGGLRFPKPVAEVRNGQKEKFWSGELAEFNEARRGKRVA